MFWSSFTTVFDTEAPPDAAAVVSVAPLGAAVVSDESPVLHAAASNEIAAIPASARLADVIRFHIPILLYWSPVAMRRERKSHGGNCRSFDEVMPG